MAKILHGIVDDGTREIPLVNKYGKTICTVYMRPADFSIVDRYNALMQNFNDVVKPLTELSIRNDGTAEFEQDWQVLKAVEANLKQKINELFDFDVVQIFIHTLVRQLCFFLNGFCDNSAERGQNFKTEKLTPDRRKRITLCKNCISFIEIKQLVDFLL